MVPASAANGRRLRSRQPVNYVEADNSNLEEDVEEYEIVEIDISQQQKEQEQQQDQKEQEQEPQEQQQKQDEIFLTCNYMLGSMWSSDMRQLH